MPEHRFRKATAYKQLSHLLCSLMAHYRQHIFQILCVAALSQAIGQMPHAGRDLLKAD